MGLDFTAIIDKYIPQIHHFIDIYDYEEVIHDKLSARNKKRASQDRPYSPFLDGDFYDLLMFTTKVGDGITDERLVWSMVNLLGCYNALLEALNERLLPEQKGLLADTIGKVLRNANKDYRHYFGELFALDVALKNGFEFCKSAVQIGNKKDAEYLIKDSQDGREYMLEVVNVLVANPNPKLTKEKLAWKLNNKLKEGADGSNFILLPVIWWEKLETVEALAKGIEEWDVKKFGPFKDDRVLPPFSLFPIMMRSGNLKWEFTFISKVLVGFNLE